MQESKNFAILMPDDEHLHALAVAVSSLEGRSGIILIGGGNFVVAAHIGAGEPTMIERPRALSFTGKISISDENRERLKRIIEIAEPIAAREKSYDIPQSRFISKPKHNYRKR